MKFKKRLVGLMLATALTTFTFALTSCKDEEESSSSSSSGNSSTESVKFEQTGEYYCGISDGEYTLTIGETDCRLVMGSETLTGTYAYDGEEVSIVFSDGSLATATVKDTVLTFKKGNATYTFYEKIEHTVTYETNGGSAVAETKIINGKVLAEPTAPTKEGYWFIGWYTDAECKKSSWYKFDEQVMGNTKLYARFVEKVTQDEFKVNFVVDGETAFEEMATKGGVVYNPELPTPTKEGATFAGWWVSSYGDDEKLTYKYDEQKLGQNTTLYAVWESEAPRVSVTSEGVSWDAAGGDTYKVVIKNAQGNNIAQTTTPDTSYAFDFSEWAEGDYTVEVSVSGKTQSTTAYYKNKALDRITHFNVTQDRVLVFNEIENATKYLITVSCGDHTHTQTELTTPVFDFADCAMQQGGITFTVQATADGYVASAPETYTFEATLADVTGLTINENTEIVTWDAVENAESYMVEIIDDGVSLGKKSMTETTVSLRGLTGSLEVKVYPVSRYYNSSAVQTDSFVNNRLAVPGKPWVEGHALVWAAVDNATGYKVKVGTEEYEVSTNRLDLTDEHFTNNESVLSVQAICADATKSSLYSDSLTVRSDNTMNASTLAYAEGNISWGAVLGAAKYGVRVNEGTEMLVTDGLTAAITLTQDGDNKIEVRCYNAEGDTSAWVVKMVTAYAITFETSGGKTVATLYKAAGDNVTLATSEYQGYTFMGWYESANGYENNAAKHANSFKQGESDLTLYAGWKSNPYVAELQLGENGELAAGVDVNVEVLYNKAYTLPVPSSKDAAKIFAGWYTEENGQGLPYTDMKGSPVSTSNPDGLWKDAENVTLYAHWYTVLSFTEIEEGANAGYAVSKNDDGIDYIEHLTIPAMYNGKAVTTIDGGAFADCTHLKTVRIPDTIKNIFISSDDKVDTGSAFDGCTNLEKLIVYQVDSTTTYETYYESDEVGALLYKNPVTGKKEFKFLPSTFVGEYQIPDGVEVIPTAAFKNSRISKIIIPASVTQIDSSAFANCRSLKELEFLAQTDDKDEKDLTIANGVFKGCSALTEIELPARVVNLNFDIFDDKVKSINITGNAAPTATTVYHDIDGVLCLGKTLVYMPRGRTGAYTIPNGIDVVGEEAFANCKYITRVDIPAWVEVIEKNAFLNCSGMRYLNLLGTAETQTTLTIEESAFFSCKLLAELVLPENVIEVGANAFGNTQKLTKVTLNVKEENTKIAAGAFADKNGAYYVKELIIGEYVKAVDIASVFGTNTLTSVTVNENNQNIASYNNALYSAGYEKIIYFPSSIKSAYTLHPNTKVITAKVFQGKNLTEISIPASVTTIEASAFEKCHSLVKIHWLPAEENAEDVALTIGDRAFYNVPYIYTLDLPARVTSIGASAFADSNYTSVTIADGDMELNIGANAFENCLTITSLSLPTRLRTIGEFAFASAFKRTVADYETYTGIDVVIPEGVTAIGDYAFKSNRMMKTVSLPATLVKMGAYDNDTLTSVRVFEDCAGLQTITIADGNTAFAINSGVLYNKDFTELYLSPLKNTGVDGVVDIPKTVTKIWDYAFKSNTRITSITFSEGVEGALTFGTDVFRQCTALTKVDLPVGLTEIPTMLFYYCESLEEVTIPWTVATIKTRAFEECDNLTTVNFQPTPQDETPVELTLEDGQSKQGVFYVGTKRKLTNVQLPERTVKIGSYAMYDLLGTEYTIPSTVTTLGQYAFHNCAALVEIKFAPGSKLTTIPQYAFNNCNALTTIEIPASVTKIDKNAFNTSELLANVTFNEGLAEIGDNAFAGLALTSLAFPASLTTIGANAFENCLSLTSVTFEDNSTLQTIGTSAFKGCVLLGTTITIPASTEEIGASAFESCEALTSVTFVEENNTMAKIGANAFAFTGLTSFTFPASSQTLTLGDGILKNCELTSVHLTTAVSDINGGEVFGAKSIETITVADDSAHFTVMNGQKILLNKEGTGMLFAWGDIEGTLTLTEGFKYVDDYVFKGQTKLTSLKLPISLNKIGVSAFENCTALTAVDFGTATGADHLLAEIGASAFKGCTALTAVELPKDLAELGEAAFMDCTALKSIKVNAKLTTIGKDAFRNATNSAELADGEYATIELEYGLKTIGENMFWTVSNVNEIVIPTTVETIGVNGFSTMRKLASVSFDEDTTDANEPVLSKIGNGAFANTDALTQISLPNSVTELGTMMFQNSGLTQIGLPEGITAIPASFFLGCKGFTQFTIPATVQTIGSKAFFGCTNITTMNLVPVAEEGETITPSLTAIKSEAFSGCTKISSIVIPETVEMIETKAFYNCSGMTTLKLKPDGENVTSKLKTVGDNAFESCKGVTSLVIPNSVTSIGAKAFYAMSGLTSLTFEARAEDETAANLVLGKEAFCLSTAKLTTLTLSNRIKTIDQAAFAAAADNNTASTGTLTTLDIPDSVTSLGLRAFGGWKALTTVTLGGKDLTTVGKNTFEYCTSLNNVTFRDGTTVMGEEMFWGNVVTKTPKTFTISLPTTLKKIPAKAFLSSGSENASNDKRDSFKAVEITSIDLSNVTEIGNFAFAGATKLADVTWGDKLEIIGKKAFRSCTSLDGALDLSASVKTVGMKAFMGSYITSVKLGSNFTSNTTGYQFAGCTKLESVELPTNLTQIDTNMFNDCTALVTVTLPANVTTIKSKAFYGCTNLENLISAGSTDSALAKVTTLELSAFENCKALTSVDLSSLTTSLGGSAFKGCILLSSVTFNDSLGEIGSSAFSGCTALTSITLPKNLTSIKNGVFASTGLTSIVIPASVTDFTDGGSSTSSGSYGAHFKNCTSLNSVTFLGNVTRFGKEVFYGCTALTRIDLPDTVYQIGQEMFTKSGLTYIDLPADLQEIGKNAFSNCSKLGGMSIANTNEYFKVESNCLITRADIGSGSSAIAEGTLMIFPMAGIDEDNRVLAIPEGVTAIQAGLFKDCTAIEEIILPSTLTTIGDSMFANFTGLKRVTIPTTVTYIGMTAFGSCTSLEEVEFEDDVNAPELYGYNRCFEGCTALTSMKLPSRMKTVGESFLGATTAYLTNLTQLELAEGIEIIEESAFAGTGITDITLPSTLTYIGKKAFQAVPINALTIPANVTYVGTEAFAPFGSTHKIKTYAKIKSIVIPATVTTWGSGVFMGCADLTEVSLADGVTHVPASMFKNCTSLTSIDLTGVTSLGAYALANTGLTSVVIPDSVQVLSAEKYYASKTSEDYGLFSGCTALASVTLPASLKAIAGKTFYNCSNLTEIKISGVEYDAEKGFVVPETVEIIGANAFFGAGITKVKITSTDTIYYQSFTGANKLTSVELSDGIQYLGYQMFKDCTALTQINLPSTLVSFVQDGGYYNSCSTFEGCTRLSSIVIPDGVTEIGNKAFYGCAGLTSVKIGAGVEKIHPAAFGECTGIESLVIPAKAIVYTSSWAMGFENWTVNQTINICASKDFVDAKWYSSWKSYSCKAKIVYDYVPPVEDEEA